MRIYKITLPLQQRSVEHDNRTSLLETLEKNGIFHEYQCRSGYCGSSRVKLLNGRVSYAEMPLAFLQQNEILLCCCRVESDLEIEF